jgi:hypothetical protein
MTALKKQKRATSSEVAGGAGFTYADTVAAYYLAALLREERAAGLGGIVRSVAVEQASQGNPMDDIVVEFDDGGSLCTLGRGTPVAQPQRRGEGCPDSYKNTISRDSSRSRLS